MNREPWVSVQEVASHLDKSVYTVRRWARNGEIPGVRKGRDWLFQLSAIDAALSAPVDVFVQSPRSRGRRRVT